MQKAHHFFIIFRYFHYFIIFTILIILLSFSTRCVYLHKCDDQVGCCSGQKQHCVAMEQKVVFKFFYNLSSDKRQSRVVRLEFVNDTKCQCRELDNIHHHSLAELNSRQSIMNAGRPGNQLNGNPLNENSLNGNRLAGDAGTQLGRFQLSNNELESNSFAPVQHPNAMRSADLNFNDRSPSARFTINDSSHPAELTDGRATRPSQASGYARGANVPGDQFIVAQRNQPSLSTDNLNSLSNDPYSKYESWRDFNNLVLTDDLSAAKTMERPPNSYPYSNSYWNNKKFNGKLSIQHLFDCKTAKLCPEPYTIIQSRDQRQNNLCYCGCKSRSVNCIKVMNGLRRLDNQAIQCVLSGQCLLPECLYTSDDYQFNKNTGHCPTREEVLGIY